MGIPFHPKQKKFSNLGHEYNDTEELIKIINRDVFVVGYSLGAIRLCHFLGSKSSLLPRVKKAFLGFVEFDPAVAFHYPRKIALGLGGLNVDCYNKLNREYLVNHGFTEQDFIDMKNEQTMIFWDEVCWCRHGYHMKSVEEYYDFIDVRPHMRDIRVPTLFFAAEDDQLTGDCAPLEIFESNEALSLVTCDRGNHLGCVLKNGSDVPSTIAV